MKKQPGGGVGGVSLFVRELYPGREVYDDVRAVLMWARSLVGQLAYVSS